MASDPLADLGAVEVDTEPRSTMLDTNMASSLDDLGAEVVSQQELAEIQRKKESERNKYVLADGINTETGVEIVALKSSLFSFFACSIFKSRSKFCFNLEFSFRSSSNSFSLSIIFSYLPFQ